MILGIGARGLADLVSEHFTVGELTRGRGWWPDDAAGEAARYEYAARAVFEVARSILGVSMSVISGARPAEHNTGKASSMHLPPAQRVAVGLRFLKLPPAERGAAIDFIPGGGMPCDEAFRRLDAAQRSGKLPPAGLFWYAADKAHPGPATGRFVHIDYRPNGLAREKALQPPAKGG